MTDETTSGTKTEVKITEGAEFLAMPVECVNGCEITAENPLIDNFCQSCHDYPDGP